MLYRLEITTTEQLTIERDSMEEAEARARTLEQEYNRDHHHGEKTTIKVVYVPYKQG